MHSVIKATFGDVPCSRLASRCCRETVNKGLLSGTHVHCSTCTIAMSTDEQGESFHTDAEDMAKMEIPSGIAVALMISPRTSS